MELMFVVWLTSQQHGRASEGQNCPDSYMLPHREAADQTFYFT